MNKSSRYVLYTFIAIISVVVTMNFLGSSTGILGPKPVNFDYSGYIQAVEGSKVRSADWLDKEITGELADGQKYRVQVTTNDSQAGADLLKILKTNGVKIKNEPPPVAPSILIFVTTLGGPLLLVALFYFLVWRPAQAGGNQAMSFGRSKAKRVGETGQKITFDDVAGIDEAKQELFEIVDFLKNTKKYAALGAKIPKGILLTGPPGVGKTHLARAISGEAGVPFFHISGSDFVEMFVGVGAARVRDLFETAKAHRPCLIFIDEIDAVGRQRGAGLGGGHDEREQTLNQLLVEMDGFDANTGVIMIAATNRPDVLDPALLRPGRFDRQLVVESPDAKGREAILKVHAKGKPLDSDVDLKTIAKRTPGFTGADLANALNEAALLTARRNRSKIAMPEIEESLDRVMVGPARKSKIMKSKEREITAYHEAGHAVVGELLEHCDPIHKVTILPRGMALGLTWSLPDDDSVHTSRSEILDDIAMSLGGLVAEEVIYGERWTGATSDLDRVTRLARAMVCEFGMSEKLGTLAIGRRSRNPFLGRSATEDRDYSEEVARMIDEEVRHIVDTQHQRATEILVTHRETLDRIVQALLERETLSREEFLALINGEPIPDRTEPTDRDRSGDSDAEKANDKPKRVAPPRFEPGPA